MEYEKSEYYRSCFLCSRSCGIDRTGGKIGFCKSSDIPKITRADLHMWEEPIISGERGSGTIFFSGCSLGCVYCQNSEISRSSVGREVSSDDLADIMEELEKKGAHNINFVTPTHFAPSVRDAVDIARNRGLCLPIVYNTGSYDSIMALEMLKGRVDVYLADLKYYRGSTAKKLSYAEDYPVKAKNAIAEMVRQQPTPTIEDGIMKRGVIVRVLLLPSHLAEAKLSVKYLYENYGDDIYLSLMSQYTPPLGMAAPLNRRVTSSEYSELVSYAEKLGVVNAFTQEISSSSEAFIPDFYTE